MSITTVASIGNNAMPQCSFTANTPGHKPVGLTANVDTSPSPYYRLERTAVETTQVIGPSRELPVPSPVAGLGLEAYWFPTQTQLKSTDGVRLVTVSVNWPGAKESRKLTLAAAVSRTYLTTPRGQTAQALAKGAPSPTG